MDLLDKVAIVTGGSMGIGAAIALELARRGTSIAIVARHSGPPALEVQQQIVAGGRRCAIITADLRHADGCCRAVQTAAEHLGRLDVLVHNAGGPSPGTIDQVSPEQWLATMDLHVNANYFLCRAALPYSAAPIRRCHCDGVVDRRHPGRPRGHRLRHRQRSGPQFTRALARDLADDNIRVNCVAPGVVRTRFHADMSEERRQFNLDQRIPLHREGTPQQVADVVALLITNDYITGETFVIDGGLTSRIA